MSFSLVQSAALKTASASTPQSLSFTNPVGSGNMVIVVVGQFNASGDALTDNKGNTYNLRFSHEDIYSSYLVDIYDCLNVTNGPQTVTFSLTSGSGNPIVIYMAEFTPSGTLDQSNAAIVTPTSAGAVTGTSVTPTTSGELVFAAIVSEGDATPTPGSGFTTILTDTGSVTGVEAILQYQVQTTAAAVAPTASGFSQYVTAGAFILTYKAAATAAALTAALRVVTAGRATPAGKVPLLARGTTEASGRGSAINAIELAARGAANAAGRVGAGGYRLAMRATAGGLATGRSALAGKIPLLARGATEVFSRASVTAATGLYARGAASITARASAAGSVALRAASGALASGIARPAGTVKILARGAAQAVGRASITSTLRLVSLAARAAGMAQGSAALAGRAGLSARVAANTAGRLGSGTYSLALKAAAGALAGGRGSPPWGPPKYSHAARSLRRRGLLQRVRRP